MLYLAETRSGIVGVKHGTVSVVCILCAGIQARAGSNSEDVYMALEAFKCADFVDRYRAEFAARSANDGDTNTIYTANYAAMYYYIAGWLSSYNFNTTDNINIISNGLNGAALWIDNWCRAYPLDTLEAALLHLTDEAYPTREK
jgi:hypothetical protein